MNRIVFLGLFASLVLTSCSSVYKTGQTPDDVYYSPAREIADEEDNSRREERYEVYNNSVDDNYLRMKVRNRYRWSRIDDFDYWHDVRYNYSCNCHCPNNFNYHYSPYIRVNYGWNGWTTFYPNNWNNPYFTVIPYKNPKVFGNTSGSNISAYRNRVYNNTNTVFNNPKINGSNNQNNNRGFGNLLKRVFSNGGNSSSSSGWDRPQRTFDTRNGSSGTSSSAGGRSGGYNSSGSTSSGGRGGRN